MLSPEHSVLLSRQEALTAIHDRQDKSTKLQISRGIFASSYHEARGKLTSASLLSVTSIILLIKYLFQKNRSSALCQSGVFPAPSPRSSSSFCLCWVLVRSRPCENHSLPPFKPCSTSDRSSFSTGLSRIAALLEVGESGRRR